MLPNNWVMEAKFLVIGDQLSVFGTKKCYVTGTKIICWKSSTSQLKYVWRSKVLSTHLLIPIQLF